MTGSKGAEEQGRRRRGARCGGYEDAATYGLGKGLAVEVHKLPQKDLPRFELCDEGIWVRRSSKSVLASFVEDCGMNRHKADLARYLTHCLASCGETKAHLELLRETKLP